MNRADKRAGSGSRALVRVQGERSRSLSAPCSSSSTEHTPIDFDLTARSSLSSATASSTASCSRSGVDYLSLDLLLERQGPPCPRNLADLPLFVVSRLSMRTRVSFAGPSSTSIALLSCSRTRVPARSPALGAIVEPAATWLPNRRGASVKKLLMLLVLAVFLPAIAGAGESTSELSVSENAASALQERDGCAENLLSAAEDLPLSRALETVPGSAQIASSGSCCTWGEMNHFCNNVCGEAGWSSNGGWCLDGHCQIDCTCNDPALEQPQ